MPAVSDAGPLIHLAQIGKLELLKGIFVKITVVPSVKYETVDEGIRLGFADAVVVEEALKAGWIKVKKPGNTAIRRSRKLAEDENVSQSDAQTLLMARSLKRRLLTDEKNLAKLGRMYGLEVWNTWTVLLEALRRGLIGRQDIDLAISELAHKRHKLTTKQAREILKAADRVVSSKP